MPSFPTISLPFPPLSTLSVPLPSSLHQPLSTLSLPLPDSLSEPIQLPNYIRPSPTTAIHLPSRQSLQGVYTILSPPHPTPSASTSTSVSTDVPLSGFSSSVPITEGVSESLNVPHTNIESLTTGGGETSVTVHHSTTFPPLLLPVIQTSSNIGSCIGEAMNTLFHNNPASGDETLPPSTTTGSLPPQKEVAPINMTTPSAQLGENVLISQSQDSYRTKIIFLLKTERFILHWVI